jgi:pimeloyl-ACP methyl ester carboxylesterase
MKICSDTEFKTMVTGLAAAAVLLLTGCTLLLRDTPTPIPTKTTRASASARAATLVVFLPGRGDSMSAFEREGFLTTLHEAGVKADTLTADAHLGYYYKRTVIDRLWADVLQPARAQGYSRIVIVGVSLGGVGALFCEREHPGAANALVLLGPYLGDNKQFFERITAAGGPAAWAAGRDLYADDVEEQLWTFLGAKSVTLPPTWLLYGKSDSLALGHRQLAELLPSTHVLAIDGAHDWPTWRALWREVCFNSDLFRAEKASPPNAPTR